VWSNVRTGLPSPKSKVNVVFSETSKLELTNSIECGAQAVVMAAAAGETTAAVGSSIIRTPVMEHPKSGLEIVIVKF